MINVLFYTLGPLVTLSLARITQIGWQPVMGLHLFLFALFTFCFIFKRKISYKFLGGATIFLFLAVAMGAILHNQNIVYGSSYFVISILFMMLFFSLRGSIFLMISISVLQFILLYVIEDTILIHHILQVIGNLVLNTVGLYIIFKLKDSLITYIESLTFQNTELEEAKSRANVANKAKTDFLATITHELRTPLNGVLGATQILRNEKHLAEQKEFIEIIQDSGNHLLNLINDFLDISKIEAGKVILSNDIVDLNSFFVDLCKTYSVLANKKGVTFENRIQEALPYVQTDEMRLRQILLNILSNSLKFTEKGSVKFNVSSELEGEQLVCTITVSDTGIGISNEKQELLFEKFQQADMSIQRNFGGTGLGLAITKELVKLLNGSITFSSTLNIGSSFTIKLPFMISRSGTQIKSKNINAHKSTNSMNKNKRILVVDDNKMTKSYWGNY